MAAGILENDRFGEVRAGDLRAWHGLGDELEEGLNCEEGFRQLGIAWGSRLIRLVGVDDENEGKSIPVDDKFLHIRDDNRMPLGVVGEKYRPIPNLEMARFGDALVGVDARVQCATAGTLYNGRRVFATVKLPKTIEVVADDLLELFVILSNSHDGSTAFNIYPSSIRVVCQNTLTMSERDLSKGIRIQHTGKIDNKVEKARAVLGIVVHETKRFEDDIKTAVRLNLTKAQAAEYFKAVYHQVFGKIAEGEGVTEGADGTTVTVASESTRVKHRAKMIERWMQLLDDPRQNIKGITGTGWAAYNAFSQWSDHERGNMRGVQDSDVRLHSNVFGISNLTKRRAWKQVLSLA